MILKTSGPWFFIIMGIIMIFPALGLGLTIIPKVEEEEQLSEMK